MKNGFKVLKLHHVAPYLVLTLIALGFLSAAHAAPIDAIDDLVDRCGSGMKIACENEDYCIERLCRDSSSPTYCRIKKRAAFAAWCPLFRCLEGACNTINRPIMSDF